MSTTTNLLQLNDDCLFEIFTNLEMSQLLVMGDTCTRLRTAVRTHYKNTLPSCKYVFRGLGDVQIIKAFRMFGENFEKVDSKEFGIAETAYKSEEMFIEVLSRFCSDNLTELKLYRFNINNDDVIAKIKHLFPNLTSFQLECCYFPDGIVMDVLPVQCPKLKRLTLDCAAIGCSEDSSIRSFTLNQNFPHLKEFTLGYADIVDICAFLKMNSQLTIYKNNNCDTRDFKYIVELLPNIESLNLSLIDNAHFENIDRLKKLNSLSIILIVPHRRVILRNLTSISLQHLYLSHFNNLNHATADISQLINLKTLKLHRCTIDIDMDYVIDICKKCTVLTEIHVQESCDQFPSTEQLIEIVRCGEKLEKLFFFDVYNVQVIPNADFMHLTQIVKNRQKKIFISIGNQRHEQILKSFTNTNIEIQYTGIEKIEEI